MGMYGRHPFVCVYCRRRDLLVGRAWNHFRPFFQLTGCWHSLPDHRSPLMVRGQHSLPICPASCRSLSVWYVNLVSKAPLRY